MTTKSENYRKERIDRLLHELQYEISRGIMEREIDETIRFEFVLPFSNVMPGGVVYFKLQARPMMGWDVPPIYQEPRLRLVGKD
jgi:hypothetical protein